MKKRMKTKVLIFDNSQNLISNTALKIEKFFLENGLFDFSFLTTSLFEEFENFLKNQRNENQSIIILCKNDKLDECLDAVKCVEDKLSLVDEQAIKLENESQKLSMLFIPLELEFEKFLKDFIPEEKLSVFSIFGKSLSFVDSKFEEFKTESGSDYKIITKHPYLHTVYCSHSVDDEKLQAVFGQSVYSKADVSLAETLNELLKQNNKNIFVVEYGTLGNVSAGLNCENLVLKTQEELKNVGVTQELNSGETLEKEVVFALSKHALSKSTCDLVLSVCDNSTDEQKTFISVGDRETLHLYSSVFVGDKRERLNVLQDFAIFRVICFLNSKR